MSHILEEEQFLFRLFHVRMHTILQLIFCNFYHINSVRSSTNGNKTNAVVTFLLVAPTVIY